MARKGRPRKREPLPPALPPETRPIGQLVAETLRFYGRNFWKVLLLGLPSGAVAVVGTLIGGRTGAAVAVAAGAILVTGSYVAACALVAPHRPSVDALAVGLSVGVFIYVPAIMLASLFVLPGLAWFALVGLSVPAAVIEGHSFRNALRRGMDLGRADYLHALGALATFVILVFVTQGAMYYVLRAGSDQAARVASFLASLVVSPVLLVGTALLYYDQAARLRSRQPARERRRDADVPDADDAHGSRSADAPVESRPAAGGEP